MASNRHGPFSLETFVRNHEGHFMSDKFIKTFGYIAGCLGQIYERTHGVDHPTTVGLKQICTTFQTARMAIRFQGGYCGLLVEFENMKNLSFLGGWKSTGAKLCLYAGSISLVQYYILENLAYLGWSAPGWIGKKLKRFGGADEMGRLSCYGWGSWCFFDIVSCFYRLQELGKMEQIVKETYKDGCVNKKEALAQCVKSRRSLRYNMIRSTLFLIPDLQWCLKPGSKWAILPEWSIQVMCLVEALLGYYTYWTGHWTSRPQLPAPSGDLGNGAKNSALKFLQN